MAYTLNTSHALYANLIELIGVQSGALVSHKTARTFTVDAAASFGTGAFGEHFRTAGSGYTSRGALFTPAIGVDTSTIQNYTVVTVINASGANENSLSLSRSSGTAIRGPGLSAGQITVVRGGVGATGLGTTQHMLVYCRIGETSYKLYVDNGVLDYSTTSAGANYNDPTSAIDYIGSVAGGSSCNLDIVWAAVFNKELSQAELQSLYGSLGADNAFGLVESGGGGGGTDATATGTPDTLDLIAPSATAVGTGSANGSASGSPSPASITAPAATATGTTAGSGTITTPALKNNTGTILASISGWTVNVYNASTGTLVVQKTGLTTSAGGVLTVTDAAIATGTTYAYEPVHSTYGRRLPTGAAS